VFLDATLRNDVPAETGRRWETADMAAIVRASFRRGARAIDDRVGAALSKVDETGIFGKAVADACSTRVLQKGNDSPAETRWDGTTAGKPVRHDGQRGLHAVPDTDGGWEGTG
jgi:hypothetical protein